MASFKARLMIIFGCCLLLIGIAVTTAAADCPTLVQSALKTIADACSDTGRNQACYGNIALSAQPQTGIDTLNFHQKGDRVNLLDVKSLQLSAMDASSGLWGVALLKVQANLPDTLPGQNVTFLLFGDVSLNNAQTDSVGLTTHPNDPVFGPMQAFYFRSGLNDAPCEQAPSSGILIQSPPQSQRVQLRINAVDITLGSTIYVQLSSATEMTVSVVEGQATLTAFGKTVVAPAGTRVRVAVDATTLAASAAPSDAEAYIAADLASLPIQHLPLVVSVATALDVNALATLAASQPTAAPAAVGTLQPTPTPASASTASDLPVSGDWHSHSVGSGCATNTGKITDNDQNIQISFEQDGAILVITWSEGGLTYRYERTAPGIYSLTDKPTSDGVLQAILDNTIQVYSANHLSFHSVWRYSIYDYAIGCTWDNDFTYIGPAGSPSPTPTS